MVESSPPEGKKVYVKAILLFLAPGSSEVEVGSEAHALFIRTGAPSSYDDVLKVQGVADRRPKTLADIADESTVKLFAHTFPAIAAKL